MAQSHYGDGLWDYLTLDNRDVATATGCPKGWAVRIDCIKQGRPGADGIYQTRELAMAAGLAWFKALDIVPWD